MFMSINRFLHEVNLYRLAPEFFPDRLEHLGPCLLREAKGMGGFGDRISLAEQFGKLPDIASSPPFQLCTPFVQMFRPVIPATGYIHEASPKAEYCQSY